MAKTKSKGRVRANGLGTVSQDKQRGTWIAKVLTGYTEEGKPVYVKRRAKTKTEAEHFLNELHAEKKTGRLAPATGLNVGTYLDSWVSKLPSSLAPNTAKSYRQMVTNHLKPQLGSRRLADLSPGEIEAVYRRLEDKGLVRMPSYAHRVLTIALSEAIRLGHLQRNPMERVKAPVAAKKRAENFHSAEETIKLLDYLKTVKDNSAKLLMLLGIETGARISELMGITWDSIDLDRGMVAINAQLAKVDKQWVLRPLKTTKSERIKLLSPDALATLKLENAARMIDETKKHPLGLALLNSENRPWNHNHADETIKAICKAAGVRAFPSHTVFRHTYATALLKSGVSLHDASREMGHSSVSLTTDLNGHHAFESTKKAAAARNAYLEEAREQQKKKTE